ATALRVYRPLGERIEEDTRAPAAAAAGFHHRDVGRARVVAPGPGAVRRPRPSRPEFRDVEARTVLARAAPRVHLLDLRERLPGVRRVDVERQQVDRLGPVHPRVDGVAARVFERGRDDEAGDRARVLDRRRGAQDLLLVLLPGAAPADALWQVGLAPEL